MCSLLNNFKLLNGKMKRFQLLDLKWSPNWQLLFCVRNEVFLECLARARREGKAKIALRIWPLSIIAVWAKSVFLFQWRARNAWQYNPTQNISFPLTPISQISNRPNYLMSTCFVMLTILTSTDNAYCFCKRRLRQYAQHERCEYIFFKS